MVAVGHSGETDPTLEREVGALTWVRVGQLDRIVRILRKADVQKAVMAGGIGRVRAIADARPDIGALKVALRLRSLRDDALLRAVANYFGEHGIAIVPQAEYLSDLLAPEGHLAGPKPSAGQSKDIALGCEVAQLLGKADVGQTVVVKNGLVLALEAVEGTDEAIRRGSRLGGPGTVVVKLCKPGQDERFDLPAIGPGTLGVMLECGAKVLAVEARKTLLLDPAKVLAEAERSAVSLLAVPRRKQ